MKQKKSLVAVNKVDLVESRELLAEITDSLSKVAKMPVYLISANTGEGIPELAQALMQVVSDNA
jgi:selenocysteine-specific translation elongation factor